MLSKTQPLPDAFLLKQNYPNPFRTSTTIEYALSEPGRISINVFDVLGRQVTTLVDRIQPAGFHQIVWDGNDQQGNSLPAGVFILKFLREQGQQKVLRTVKVE